jgi:hypothetical protein
MFPRSLITVLIVGSLVLTVGSVVSLLVLLLGDYRNKRLW